MILSGYVNTSSVPHYDCGDAELAHFSFLTDTNLFFSFSWLSTSLVILV